MNRIVAVQMYWTCFKPLPGVRYDVQENSTSVVESCCDWTTRPIIIEANSVSHATHNQAVEQIGLVFNISESHVMKHESDTVTPSVLNLADDNAHREHNIVSMIFKNHVSIHVFRQ